FAFSLMALAYGIASAPTRTASRLGLRGLKRTRILAENEIWASIEPLVRWLGVRVSGIPTDEQRAQLEKHIALAGDYMGLTADKSSNPEDPIVEEFTLILQTLNLGRTRKDALEEFAKRCPVDAVTEFVNSLVQAEERGNPVAEVLSIQATVSRTRRSVRAEEMAAKAGVKLVGPLMLVFFCVMGLLLGPALMKISSDL